MENKVSLQFKRNREKKALTDYRRRRRDLLRLAELASVKTVLILEDDRTSLH